MNTQKWYEPIGAHSNFWMSQKAFWLRSAAHYRRPLWRNISKEMEALRMVKQINRELRAYLVN